MGARYSAPRGTQDILPDTSHLWQYVEARWRDLCHLYGYREIRTPIFEETELFTRSVGEATDIVSKEMYTFEDRGGRSLTLKPEGTAPVVRAYLEHSLHAQGGVQKLYYITPIFRYERPQKGRYRQAHQFGAEIIGTAEPIADAELLSMILHFFSGLGIPLEKLELRLNTIGCPVCRPAYREAIRQFGLAHRDALCETCRARLETNPLRILDCKVPTCQAITQNAPPIDPYLCEACRAHFERLQALLKALDVPYRRDVRLVRGLDYYTRTTFEVVAQGLGAQNALCGGGRYDGLVESCGGPPTPALGVGIGIERTLLVMQELGAPLPEPPRPLVYLVAMSDSARVPALLLAQQLRQAGIACDLDLEERSPKAQMKRADRAGARYALLLGEEELQQHTATLRDLNTHEQHTVPQAELIEWLRKQT
ncbi:MAG: histidine--tRNA ligase [Fimbriimonadales bacterium]|jgi:histidyl-tRNA synthetase|nr:histidine--tRNA ligase [Fimbriimonadales bacterium]GIV11883.1 MAG: histidine--tRNA ligase [Fimbriimonadales bacterium]CUU11271.1 histidyl-tRNA synthetase [Armatimonadetes bacterium GBS]CUU34527.1 histidyl-tRNA synthetase [Armatimonadetes bacterium GXS]